MTTATHQRPTEEDVRAWIARDWSKRYPAGGSPELEWEAAWNGLVGLNDACYDLEELRPSELARLDELTAAAIEPVRLEAERQAVAAIVGAVLQFASEYPEAPRARS